MASNRIGRINEEIQRELAQQLRLLKDPRVQKTMVSITHVETTPDLRYAKVYVSLLDRSYTPELQWQEDDSIVHGAHILDILSKLDIPEDTEDETADHS